MATTTTSNHTSASIYVACLAAYNNGKLHGTWIEATQSPDAIREAIQAMLSTSPEPCAEEWAIHDYEGFHGIHLSEWEGIEQVHELAIFVEEHGVLGAEVLTYYGNSLDDAREALTDRYHGVFSSVADFAETLTTETMEVPESLALYIDYAAMARDMELNGDIFTIETAWNEVHIFWTR